MEKELAICGGCNKEIKGKPFRPSRSDIQMGIASKKDKFHSERCFRMLRIKLERALKKLQHD